MSGQSNFRNITRTAKIGRVGGGQHGSSSDVVLSKMVRDRQYGNRGISAGFHTPESILDITAERQATNMEDYENILQTQPELELPIQILISCILSPKNASKITLKHTLKKNPLPPDLANRLLQAAKECVDDVYKIKVTLPERLRKALFTTGSDVTIIMGEAAIDDVINGRFGDHRAVATESFKTNLITNAVSRATQSIGILGNSTLGEQIAMESILGNAMNRSGTSDFNPKLNLPGFDKFNNFAVPEMIDNPKILGLSMALEDLMERKRAALNEAVGIRNFEALNKLYHDVEGGIEEMTIFPRPEESSRESKTRPIRRTVPSESCVPVFQVGAPKKHMGYLFLIDELGSFVSRDMRKDYWRNISEMVGGNRETVSSILERSAQGTSTEGQNDTLIAMAAANAFREMAIKDMERKLINGTLPNSTLGSHETFFNLMFERALAGRQTRVLYVPADMVVYWAYRYNSNGTGRSLLEDNKFLASIRSLLLVSNTETQLRNSIDYTKLGITFDPKDPHKTKTKELIIDQYVRNRLRSTPWNTTNPRRIIEMMQMAGVSIDIDGGQDGYPGTKVSIDRQDIQQRAIDMELDEAIFKRLMMGFGIAPEIVDLSTNIEFSSKIVTSNELSLKRVMVIQDVTNYLIRQDAIKTFLSDPIQMGVFRQIVEKWIASLPEDEWPDDKKAQLNIQRIIDLFLAAYEISLPRPENGLEADLEEFNRYMEAVEKAIDVTINEDAIGQLDNSALADQLPRFKAIVMQYKAIKWMVDHDFMTEILDDVKLDENAGIAEIVTSTVKHYRGINGLIKSIVPRLVAQNTLDAEQLQHLIDNLEQFRDKTESNLGETSGGSSYENDNAETDSGSDGGSDEDGDLFGDDPFSEGSSDEGEGAEDTEGTDSGDEGTGTEDADQEDEGQS